MIQAFQVAPGSIYSADKPLRNQVYCRFIKRFPCAVCRKKWGIDAAHSGAHAFGEKGSDFTCIPLCRKHHVEFDAAPGPFARKHHLDIAGLIGHYLRLWATRTERRTA